jgi:hypothetical protein
LNSWIKNALKRFSAFFAVLCMPFVYDWEACQNNNRLGKTYPNVKACNTHCLFIVSPLSAFGERNDFFSTSSNVKDQPSSLGTVMMQSRT